MFYVQPDIADTIVPNLYFTQIQLGLLFPSLSLLIMIYGKVRTVLSFSRGNRLLNSKQKRFN